MADRAPRRTRRLRLSIRAVMVLVALAGLGIALATSPVVRGWVLLRLGRPHDAWLELAAGSPGPRVEALLEECGLAILRDPAQPEDRRIAAAQLLGVLRCEAAVPDLRQLVWSGSRGRTPEEAWYLRWAPPWVEPYRVQAQLRALARLGDPGAEALVELVLDPGANDGWRYLAAESLTAVDDPDLVVRRLVTELGGPPERWVLRAFESLGPRARTALPALLPLLARNPDCVDLDVLEAVVDLEVTPAELAPTLGDLPVPADRACRIRLGMLRLRVDPADPEALGWFLEAVDPHAQGGQHELQLWQRTLRRVGEQARPLLTATLATCPPGREEKLLAALALLDAPSPGAPLRLTPEDDLEGLRREARDLSLLFSAAHHRLAALVPAGREGEPVLLGLLAEPGSLATAAAALLAERGTAPAVWLPVLLRGLLQEQPDGDLADVLDRHWPR
jgi:hypothetical protein